MNTNTFQAYPKLSIKPTINRKIGGNSIIPINKNFQNNSMDLNSTLQNEKNMLMNLRPSVIIKKKKTKKICPLCQKK